MFRNDQQRGEVCFVLCAWVRGEHWRYDGAVYRPNAYASSNGLSSGEAKMLAFARALWSGDDLLVWQGFDSRRMRDIAELLGALSEGPEAIDGWVEKRSYNKRVSAPREEWEADVRRRSRA